jgi:hypothetical protein
MVPLQGNNRRLMVPVSLDALSGGAGGGQGRDIGNPVLDRRLADEESSWVPLPISATPVISPFLMASTMLGRAYFRIFRIPRRG